MISDYIHPISTVTASEYLTYKLIADTAVKEQPTIDNAIWLSAEIENRYGKKISASHLLRVWDKAKAENA